MFMRRFGMVFGVLALLLGTNLAFTGPASAAVCGGTSWRNVDPATGSAPDPAPIRTGPAARCRNILTAVPGATLRYDCFVVNGAGNRWTHVSTTGQALGWIYSPNLSNGGSRVRC